VLNIRTVASDSLADLAVAVADPDDPVIYINPRLMARYGPLISAFVLAHEEAHIRLGHRRPAGGPAGLALEELLQGFELEADCGAAVELRRIQPAALSEAIRMFQKLGAWRMDPEHPSGSARAARLAACGGLANGDLHQIGEGPRAGSGTTPFR
jgi:hypothetical protein